MNGILEITDGTTSVNLISTGTGFHLEEWLPSISGFKEDGIWRDSALADGRRMSSYQYENPLENFLLKLNGTSQDQVASHSQSLQELLTKAVNYWTTDWQKEPVYLKVKGPRETNTRYAIIHSFKISSEGNPYSQPFYSTYRKVGYEDITLLVERGHWQSTPPGEGTATTIANGVVSGGVTYGIPAGTTVPDAVFVANKWSNSNLTHIFRYNGSFSANLAASTSFQLFSDPSADGDMIYFGIEVGSHSEPFSSLVFNLVNGLPTGGSIVWETYTSNAAWETYNAADGRLHLLDGTDGFTNSGPCAVCFQQYSPGSSMRNTTVNGVDAYWVRATISGGTWTFIPQQYNRVVYSAMWPNITIDPDGDELEGTIPSLIELEMPNVSSVYIGGVYKYYSMSTSRLLIGARSLSRGENFSAYLNAHETNLPTGVTTTLGSEVAWTTNNTDSAVGDPPRWTVATTGAWKTLFTWIIYSTTCSEYYGSFRALMRGAAYGGSNYNLRLLIQSGSGGITRTNPSRFPGEISVGRENYVTDFGKVSIPNMGYLNSTDDTGYITITVQGYTEAAGSGGITSLDIYDLILMPIDEWAGEFINRAIDSFSTGNALATHYLQVGSVTNPRQSIKCMVKNTSLDDSISSIWQPITNGPMVAQAGGKQMLWFFAYETENAAPPEITHSISATRAQRYLGMRGSS